MQHHDLSGVLQYPLLFSSFIKWNNTKCVKYISSHLAGQCITDKVLMSGNLRLHCVGEMPKPLLNTSQIAFRKESAVAVWQAAYGNVFKRLSEVFNKGNVTWFTSLQSSTGVFKWSFSIVQNVLIQTWSKILIPVEKWQGFTFYTKYVFSFSPRKLFM